MLPLRDVKEGGEKLVQQVLLGILENQDMRGTCSQAAENLVWFTHTLLGPEAVVTK